MILQVGSGFALKRTVAPQISEVPQVEMFGWKRLLGCPRKLGSMVSKWGINGYNLLVNGVYWGYNTLTNLLLTSWDIQVGLFQHTELEDTPKRNRYQ